MLFGFAFADLIGGVKYKQMILKQNKCSELIVLSDERPDGQKKLFIAVSSSLKMIF